MSTSEVYPHLSVAPDGTAVIEQTRYKVGHLAAEHFCYGWSAEELLKQHPDLRPEQVYAALTYFYDHYDVMVEQMRQAGETAAAAQDEQRLSRAQLLAKNAPV
jgi:uncharacterized protein (DUF433 family)